MFERPKYSKPTMFSSVRGLLALKVIDNLASVIEINQVQVIGIADRIDVRD